MIYTPENARGAQVHDIEADRQIRHVISVDSEAGILTVGYQPWRIDRLRGEVASYQIRFARIYSFWDRNRPVLFHCYGRVG